MDGDATDDCGKTGHAVMKPHSRETGGISQQLPSINNAGLNTVCRVRLPLLWI
ncbi:hypothetical protein JOB18_034214 [Solea senegalensis]|uniref:Uncharacterized protein n=1 Tax=Solea senegalensis TaxID=28829 RepID=A0AAV6RE43_SOLSE|nr:hypothetical protein JOB18_034214 [Solea senegalensis]